MKIVTYNIQFGLGKDGRFDPNRIASEVDGADIIAPAIGSWPARLELAIIPRRQ